MHGWPEMEKHVTDEADRLTASMVRSQFLLVGRAACLASRQSGIDVPARSWELEWTAGKGAGETSCERMGSCKAPGHESLADRLLGLAQDVHQNSPGAISQVGLRMLSHHGNTDKPVGFIKRQKGKADTHVTGV